MNISLKDKNAFVCGSSQGIGRACAEELAISGANITLIARNEERLKEVHEGLDTSQGQIHDYLVIDFSNPENLKSEVMQYFRQKRKIIHILINNTGGPKGGPITEATTQAFLDGFTQHLICNQILAQAVLPGMSQVEYGRIINIISTSVKIPLSGLGVSNTIRGAVASWAKTLSNEVAEKNITVNNILPGYTYTERLKSLAESWAQNAGVNREEMEVMMKKSVPAKRFGKPEETANLAAFLASPAAAYITGTSIRVDGGRTGSI